MALNSGLFTSNNPAYETPKELFDKYDNIYHFTLDACADSKNTLVSKYYDKTTDCRIQDWSGEVVWMNPPYGREIGSFIKKAYEENKNHSVKTVMLLPARTDTEWFHKYIYRKKCAKITFLKGRLHFCQNGIPDKNGAPFPSMIVEYK